MKHLRLLILGSFVACAQLLQAQAPPPGGGGGGGGGGGATTAPVDGASGILVIAAAAYGYAQLRKKQASQEDAK